MKAIKIIGAVVISITVAAGFILAAKNQDKGNKLKISV